MSSLIGFTKFENTLIQKDELIVKFKKILSKSSKFPSKISNVSKFLSCIFNEKSNFKSFDSDFISIIIVGYLYGVEDEVHYLVKELNKHNVEKVLYELHGDYTLIVHNKIKNYLYLIRDKVGICPLYYSFDTKSNFIGFSTNSASLGVSPSVGFELNKHYVDVYAGSHYRLIDNNRNSSPFKNIFQVPAGHFVKFDLSNMNYELQNYWNVKNKNIKFKSENELIEEYKFLIKLSVEQRLKKANSPTFTLSGGMDSSSILAVASLLSKQSFEAYSSVYSDKTYDETEDIKSMLRKHVKKWNPVKIEGINLFNDIKKLVTIHNEPVATATWLSHFKIVGNIYKSKFDSLFGGLGGDELNAGEYEYFFYRFADIKFEDNTDLLDFEIKKWAEYHNHPIYIKNKEVALNKMLEVCDLSKKGICLVDEERKNKYANLLNESRSSINNFKPKMDHFSDSYLNNRTMQDIFYETAPCCIRAENRQTNYYGINSFLPFYDDRLVDFMLNVNGKYKIKDGVTKYLLRKAMRGILPHDTIHRIKKTGWNAPSHLWFTKDSYDDVYDMITSSKFVNRDIYNACKVKKIFEDHVNIVSKNMTIENHMMFLWQLVNLNLWMDWVDDLKVEFGKN